LRGLLVALIIGRIGLVCTGQSAPSRPRQRPSAAKHSTLRCLAAVCVTRYMKKYRLPRACATNPPQSQEPRWVEEFGKSCLVLPMIDIANDNSRSSQDFALPGCANSSCVRVSHQTMGGGRIAPHFSQGPSQRILASGRLRRGLEAAICLRVADVKTLSPTIIQIGIQKANTGELGCYRKSASSLPSPPSNGLAIFRTPDSVHHQTPPKGLPRYCPVR